MMVRVLIWTPKRFKNQLINIMKISAMLSMVLLVLFIALINSTHQFNQNPDYNAARSRFTNVEDNNYLNIINNSRSGFVLPHNAKLFPKGSRILPLFLISQSLSKEKDDLERSRNNESHTLINTSTQVNNETPIIRNLENPMINREKSLENMEIRTEKRISSPVIQEDEYRVVTEQSTFTLNDDELKMSTEKLLNSKVVSKNDGTNNCYDENDSGPTLEFQINVPVHLRIAKDRNGNGFNLKSIDLGQSKKKVKDDLDQKLLDRNVQGINDQDLLKTQAESGSTEQNIVEKAMKHTEKPFSLVKFVSNLFHIDPNTRKKSYEEDDDLSVEQELFGQNGLFDVEETTSRKSRVEGTSFWNPDVDPDHVEDKFRGKISRNLEEKPNGRGENEGEESFESARVIMPLWGDTRLPKDGSELWNTDGLSMQNGQQRLEDLSSPKFPQRAGLIEFQPFFDRIMNDGNENYFPPRGVLSFM